MMVVCVCVYKSNTTVSPDLLIRKIHYVFPFQRLALRLSVSLNQYSELFKMFVWDVCEDCQHGSFHFCLCAP